MTRLPLLISIPHAGTRVPGEVAEATSLTHDDILDDIDLFADRLYDPGASVQRVQVADIARPFVDLNRSPDQLPPAFPDGVVKSHTCFNVPVYREGMAPDAALVQRLLETYHTPYHRALEADLQDPQVRVMLDCHTMAEYPPPIAPDRKERRPSVNLGDNDGRSAPREITELLVRSMTEALGLEKDEISINRPFRGGYITRRHGAGPKPVIQVEINRALYFDAATPHRPAPEKITQLNGMLQDAFRDFCTRLARFA